MVSGCNVQTRWNLWDVENSLSLKELIFDKETGLKETSEVPAPKSGIWINAVNEWQILLMATDGNLQDAFYLTEI